MLLKDLNAGDHRQSLIKESVMKNTKVMIYMFVFQFVYLLLQKAINRTKRQLKTDVENDEEELVAPIL